MNANSGDRSSQPSYQRTVASASKEAAPAGEPKTYDEIYEWCLSQPTDFSNEQAHAIACYFAPKEPK